MPPRKKKEQQNPNGIGGINLVKQGPHEGKYCATITMGRKADGKPDRRVRYFNTPQDADDWLIERKLERAQSSGLAPVIPGHLTMNDFMLLWLDEVVIPNRAPKTISLYSGIARNHILPDLGTIRIDKLDALTIERLLRRKREAGVGKRTVQLIHVVLHNALNHAMRKWKLIKENPLDLVDRPRTTRHKPVFLTSAQARDFFRKIVSNPFEGIFILAIMEAMRMGEILGLRLDNVHLHNRTIDIDATLQRIDGALRLKTTKTEGSTATIPITDISVAALQRNQARQEALQKAAGTLWRNDLDLVFTTSHGTPIDQRNVNRTFKRLLKECELPDMRFHDLRHTCASLMIENGENPRIVMEKLRHSQISTTMNIYAHITTEQQRTASRNLDRLLSPPPPKPSPKASTNYSADYSGNGIGERKRVKRRLPRRDPGTKAS